MPLRRKAPHFLADAELRNAVPLLIASELILCAAFPCFPLAYLRHAGPSRCLACLSFSEAFRCLALLCRREGMPSSAPATRISALPFPSRSLAMQCHSVSFQFCAPADRSFAKPCRRFPVLIRPQLRFSYAQVFEAWPSFSDAKLCFAILCQCHAVTFIVLPMPCIDNLFSSFAFRRLSTLCRCGEDHSLSIA